MKYFILMIIFLNTNTFSQKVKKQALNCSANPGSMKGTQSNSQIIMKGNVECVYGGVIFKTKHAIWHRKMEELLVKDSVKISVENFLLEGTSGHFQKKNNKFKNINGIAFETIDSVKKIINTLKGDTMFLYLRDSTIESIVLKKNSQITYHLFNNKNEYEGKSTSQGDSIYIHFINKKMQNFKIHGNVKGTFKENINKTISNF